MKRLIFLWFPLLVILTLVSTAVLPFGTSQARAAGAAKPPPTAVKVTAQNAAALARSSSKRKPPRNILPTRDKTKAVFNDAPDSAESGGGGDLILLPGGLVEEHPQVFVVFWGSNWGSGTSLTADGQVVDNYFKDVSSAKPATAFENILTQYYDIIPNTSPPQKVFIPNTLAYKGFWIDTVNPTTDLTCGSTATIHDSDIQNEISHAISVNGWTINRDTTVVVYTPSNVLVRVDATGACSELDICAYHDFSATTPNVAYAAEPYPSSTGCQTPAMPNGNIFGDSLANLTSHEEFEAITDPRPHSATAWVDNFGLEIGDKCAWDFSAGMTNLNGHTYELQQEYSNYAHNCVGGVSLTPAEIAASPTAVVASALPGQPVLDQQVTIQNTGVGTLQWSADPLPNWVTVSPTSGTIAVGGLPVTLTLHFQNISNTPQTYTTQLALNNLGANAGVRPVVKVPITLAVTQASTQWFFAEGYTGGSFTEYLTLANPNPTAINIQVTYLLGSGAPKIQPITIQANQRATQNVNSFVGPNQNVSMVVTGNLPFIAERPIYFKYTGLSTPIPGGTDVLGATQLSQNFDFGYLDTTPGHDTYLTILNQNNATMNVTVSYFPAGGGAPIVIQNGPGIPNGVPANSRGTIHVNGVGLPAGTFSALVALSLPGLVERPLYLVDSATHFTGAADVIGVASPLADWFFAEGHVGDQFSERYILSNPGNSTVGVTVSFLRGDGSKKQQPLLLLAPGQQAFVDVNAALNIPFTQSGGILGDNSAIVHATGPILAERFQSFKYLGSIPGASEVLGSSAPGFVYYFAEGYIGGSFSEYLSLENPSTGSAAHVTVNFLPDTGAQPITRTFNVSPSSRFTVFTNSTLSGKNVLSFSMVVISDIPIVAERPMYFNYLNSGQTGGTDVIGYQAPGTQLHSSPTSAFIGSLDGNEDALNAGIGAGRWSFQTGGPIVSHTAPGPNGTLIATSLGPGPNPQNPQQLWGGVIAELDPLTGQPIGGVFWIINQDPIWTSPAVVGNIVYVGTLFGGFVEAWDFTNPTAISLKWFFQTSGAIHSSPVVVNGVVYVGSDDGHVYALDANAGTPIAGWPFAANGAVTATPVVANGLVYAGSNESFPGAGDGRMFAINATTGAQVWAAQTGGSVLTAGTLAANNADLFFGATDGKLYGLNASTGAALAGWPFQTGGFIDVKPLVVNGTIYFGSGDHYVYALNVSNQQLVWKFQTIGGVESSPAFATSGQVPGYANGLLYIGSDDGTLYVFDATLGSLIWTFSSGFPLLSDTTLG